MVSGILLIILDSKRFISMEVKAWFHDSITKRAGLLEWGFNVDLTRFLFFFFFLFYHREVGLETVLCTPWCHHDDGGASVL